MKKGETSGECKRKSESAPDQPLVLRINKPVIALYKELKSILAKVLKLKIYIPIMAYTKMIMNNNISNTNTVGMTDIIFRSILLSVELTSKIRSTLNILNKRRMATA